MGGNVSLCLLDDGWGNGVGGLGLGLGVGGNIEGEVWLAFPNFRFKVCIYCLFWTFCRLENGWSLLLGLFWVLHDFRLESKVMLFSGLFCLIFDFTLSITPWMSVLILLRDMVDFSLKELLFRWWIREGFRLDFLWLWFDKALPDLFEVLDLRVLIPDLWYSFQKL